MKYTRSSTGIMQPLIQPLGWVRKLTGTSRAMLVQAEDGNRYAVKLENNPQGTRSLVNEIVAARLYQQMGLSVPEVALINIDQTFIDRNPGIDCSRAVAIEPGIAFGSKVPADAEITPIFDFYPRRLMHRVQNRTQFGAILLADVWLAKADQRQALFVGHSQNVNAYFIDNGGALGGERWQMPSSEVTCGVGYLDREVYSSGARWEDVVPWHRLLNEQASEMLRFALDAVPARWIDRADQLGTLLGQLEERVFNLRRLFEETVESLLLATCAGF